MTSATTTPKSSLSIPWKARFRLSLLTTMMNLSRRSNGTINRLLFNLLEPKSPSNPNPVNGIKTADITVDPSRNLWFRLFVPTTTTTTTLPVIVFFHGGGFAYLGPDSSPFDDVCRRFAREISAVVVSVNYRLIPEHRYPAQYDDGVDVLKFLDDEVRGQKLLPENADLSRCFLAGDSAGGNIAHHVAERACHLTFQQLKVKGLVAIQPFFGGEERTESEIRLEGMPIVSMKLTDWLWSVFFPRGEECDRDHEAINVSGPNAIDLSKEFPATMVVIGGFDTLQDWQRKYYRWLKRCGKQVCLIEYPNMCHGFYTFLEILESGDLISQIRKFIYNDHVVD